MASNAFQFSNLVSYRVYRFNFTATTQIEIAEIILGVQGSFQYDQRFRIVTGFFVSQVAWRLIRSRLRWPLTDIRAQYGTRTQ